MVPEHHVDGATRQADNDDLFVATMHFASGALGLISGSRVATGQKVEAAVELTGSAGSARWNLNRLNELQLYLEDGDPLERGFTNILLGPDHPLQRPFSPAHGVGISFLDTKVIEAHAFLSCLNSGAMPTPGFRDAWEAARLLEQIEAAPTPGPATPTTARQEDDVPPFKLSKPRLDIAIVCSDFTASLDFYHHRLGLDIAYDLQIDTTRAVRSGLAPAPFRHVRLRAGDALIKLMQIDPPPEADQGGFHAGVRWLTFFVRDLDDTVPADSAKHTVPLRADTGTGRLVRMCPGTGRSDPGVRRALPGARRFTKQPNGYRDGFPLVTWRHRTP